VAETAIPTDDGQKVFAEDLPGARQSVINWQLDGTGSARLRPAIVNTTLDPGVYSRTTGTLQGLIGAYVWRSVFNQRDYLVYVRQDRYISAKDLITNVVTVLSTATTTTQLDGAAPVAIFAEDSQRLTIAGGGQLQTWNGNVASVTQRISTFSAGVNEPPLSATHVVGLANYLVANQSALPGTNTQIFWSGLGDTNHITWNPLNFNTADADPDAIMGIYGNLREVFAFGQKTVQAFGIGADPLLPFSSSAALALGCSAPYSPIRNDAEFVWLNETRRFVRSDARSSTFISDDIDKLIRDFGRVDDCFGFRLRLAYWDLLVWIFPTEGKTYAYDQRAQKWFQWRGWNGIDDFAAIRIAAYAFWATGNLHIVGDSLYENLWTLDAAGTSDTGPNLPIVAERVTQHLDGGTGTRKRCGKVRTFVKRGQSAQDATEAFLDVAKSDDDGPWQGSLLGLGLAGDYQSFLDWYPGGIYYRRQYRVRYSGGVDLAIARMVEFWEPLSE
jgi:hypothetical protein